MAELFIFNVLLITVFVAALLVFIMLFFITAPYGRHMRKGWGVTLKAKFGWFLMEFPSFAIIVILFFIGNEKTNPVAIIFLLYWSVHYFHRAMVYPFMMKGGNKKFPLLILSFALIFNFINAYINGRYLFFFSAPYRVNYFLDPRFIIGSVLFITGMFINIQSDYILLKLRKQGNSQGNNNYVIPYSGFFRFVSSPNYFGEIIEWVGWAVLTWSIPGLAFAVFTIANLAPRAYSNHKWYKNKFSAYPRDRKALIPFIY
jgi:steroid 5-alpha reductase family enzyme